MAEDITPEQKIEEMPQAAQAPATEDRKWYVLQTLTGNEELVKASIERTIKQFSLENKVFSVLVPEEDIVEIKEGKRVEKKKRMFPGYVFIEMILDETSWHAIKQTTGVAKFIGNKIRPIPVTDREMQRVLKQLGVREERIDVFFEKGEAIRIISGPFRGYTGSVEEINIQKSKIKALVNIFGRDTPVEIDFEQAEKMT
ncbi:MAG: transcription termination/antitermination protein NusG [bacterium]